MRNEFGDWVRKRPKIILPIAIIFLTFACNEQGDVISPLSNPKGTSAFECVSAYLYCDEQNRICLQSEARVEVNCGNQYYLCATNLVLQCLDDMDPDDKNHTRM